MVLSFTIVLRPAPAGSVSWCCCLLSCCVLLQPALCLGVVVYSRHGTIVYSRLAVSSSRLCVVVLPFTLGLCPAPAGSVSWFCCLLSFCVRLQPALCLGVVVYSRFASGSSRLCVVVLSFTLVLRLAPACSVSWCCCLLSCCVRLKPALCRGVVIKSRCLSGSVLWHCRLVSFCVRLQPALCRGASWRIIMCSNFGLSSKSVASSMRSRSHAA